jgi:tripartite-type tricarboxylate transporter receptor subunit TctC
MPKPVVDKLFEAMVEIANDPEVKASFSKQGMQSQSSTPDQSTEYFRKMKETISRLGRESNIKLD